MKDVYLNPETRATHVRRKKKSYGCGRTGWFSGHHGSTYSADKQIPPSCLEHWKERKFRHKVHHTPKKRHIRKSRYWLRNELKKTVAKY